MTHPAQSSSAPPARTAAVMQVLANLLVVGLFTLLVISSYHHFISTRSLGSLGILAVNTLFLSLFLTRQPAKAETRSPLLWVLGLAGTALPLLLRPGDGAALRALGTAIQVGGFVMVAAALLSLRRSFAVVPANRGVRIGGMYRIVRHPIYLSELTVLLGVILANPTVANVVIWMCECGLQFARARAEEEFLASDPLYLAYRERVRYRLIPGLV
jgi:protein-S-isoprenylcysteine O-methyltransferase Ste14